MKNSLITLAFIFFFAASHANNFGKKLDTTFCLELDGIILNAGTGNNSCKVELFLMGQLVDSASLIKGKNKFNFNLKKDKYYTLRFTMKDHINKVICIDTKNAEIDPDENELLYFAFETSLIPQNQPNINTNFADTPVAILYYDANSEKFSYDKQYTANVKKEMYAKAK